MTAYCQARTRAQDMGSSYASSSWSCSRRATTSYEGLPVCKQHRAMLVRDRGEPKDGLIGREDFLNEQLTKTVQSAASKLGDYTAIRSMHRGRWFEVLMADGIVMRVVVTLDRVMP